MFVKKVMLAVCPVLAVLVISGCGSTHSELSSTGGDVPPDYDYVIGPGDSMEIFVWGNEELTVNNVQVRPDGKITTRLVENIQASGKTPSQLARDIEAAYSEYVKSAVVSVIVGGFQGVPSQQVRVIGEAANPLKVPYSKHMTLLDLMVEVGGLTEFADGNDAVLVRQFGGEQKTYNIRLADLLENGDISANVPLFPGDIVIIPEAWF
ncbi:MAG: polysaccharide biosynthesis/export family protein [Pseudomonadales bacterium]|nr:polysaccharide biosynthesis/export family protein [Pseudomonadales bacterium]